MAASGASFPKKIQIGIMGNLSVGKTTLVRALGGVFDSNVEPSAASNLISKKLTTTSGTNEFEREFEVVDTSGSERYQQQFTPIYLKPCHAILVVYDITNRESFDSIDARIKEVKAAKKSTSFPFILVGTKSDLDNIRAVSLDDVKEKARELGIDENKCFEVSAKTGTNVDAPFIAAVESAIALRAKEDAARPAVVVKPVAPAPKPSLLQWLHKTWKENPEEIVFIASMILLAAIVCVVIPFVWEFIAASAVVAGILTGLAVIAKAIGATALTATLIGGATLILDVVASLGLAKIAGHYVKPDVAPMGPATPSSPVVMRTLGIAMDPSSRQRSASAFVSSAPRTVVPASTVSRRKSLGDSSSLSASMSTSSSAPLSVKTESPRPT